MKPLLRPFSLHRDCVVRKGRDINHTMVKAIKVASTGNLSLNVFFPVENSKNIQDECFWSVATMKKSIVLVTLSLSLMGCQNATQQSAAQKSATRPASVTQPAPMTQSSSPDAQQGQTVSSQAVPSPALMNSNTPGTSEEYDATLGPCLKELKALQQIKEAKFVTRNAELNHLLGEAKNYMKVRGNINSEMTNILDSAFQYRIARTCNDIRVDLTRSLLERIEKS